MCGSVPAISRRKTASTGPPLPSASPTLLLPLFLPLCHYDDDDDDDEDDDDDDDND